MNFNFHSFIVLFFKFFFNLINFYRNFFNGWIDFIFLFIRLLKNLLDINNILYFHLKHPFRVWDNDWFHWQWSAFVLVTFACFNSASSKMNFEISWSAYFLTFLSNYRWDLLRECHLWRLSKPWSSSTWLVLRTIIWDKCILLSKWWKWQLWRHHISQLVV